MRIVFDECVPRQLVRLFPEDWEICTVRELGLSGTLDADVLDRIGDVASVFLTADTTLKFQNRFSDRAFGTVSLELHANTTAGLALHLPTILAAIREVRPKQVTVVAPEGVRTHP